MLKDGGLPGVIIRNHVMHDKQCHFEFKFLNADKINKLLLPLKADKPSGVDDLGGNLLRLSAEFVAKSLVYILNRCFKECVYPQHWKIAKVTPPLKNWREPCAGRHSRPTSILPVVGKPFEGIIYKQIQQYFNDFNLNPDLQHGYRVGHSTATALTCLTECWLQHIYKKEVVGQYF